MQAGTVSMGLFMVCFHVSPSAFITPKENITCVYGIEARIAIERSLLSHNTDPERNNFRPKFSVTKIANSKRQ